MTANSNERKGLSNARLRLFRNGLSMIHLNNHFTPRTLFVSFTWSMNNLLVTTGVNVRAISKEMVRVIIMVTGNDLINAPVIYGIAAIGTKAKMVVRVAVITGHPISEAASMEASFFGSNHPGILEYKPNGGMFVPIYMPQTIRKMWENLNGFRKTK